MSSSVDVDNKEKDILILNKGPTQGLGDAPLTAEKEYAISFNEQHKKFCLSFHYNVVNSYIFVNGIKIYKFKANDSGINASPLYLGNVPKDFSANNMKKTGFTDMSMIFQLIMILLVLMIFWIFMNI